MHKKYASTLHREKIAFLEKKQHHNKKILSLQHKNEKLIVDILKTRNALKEMEQKKYKLEGYEEQTRRLENELQQKSIEISRLQDTNTSLQTQCSMLRIKVEQIQKNSEEKLQWLQGMQKQLGHTFKSLAAESLQNNNKTFMHLAQTTMEKFHDHAQMDLSSRQQAISHLVDPLYSSLQKVDERIMQMEKDRDSIYAGLTEQIKNLAATHNQLHDETSNLIRALRTPTVRGRWGEIQLKRVVEIAGMVEYCDFVEQQSVMFEESNLRPDMIIRLPNEKKVIVDSKAPLLAYLEAIEMPDNELRIEKLKLHAKHVRNHISQLSSKAYWEQFKHTPEFVVLFIPGENFFSAALEQDRQLIEYAAQQNVVLATPTSLITLLRTISYGWRQEKITQHTQQISELGKTLYERLQIFVSYLHEMRKGLERSIDSYNKAVGSFENRVLVSARKFKDLGTNNEDIEILTAIDKYPRKPNDNE